MFGYITPDLSQMNEDQKKRFQMYYCGVCSSLSDLYGSVVRVSHSYDLTFLAILLDGLYEEQEEIIERTCPVHPFSPKSTVSSKVVEYAAAMNLLLTYHKLADDWKDDRSILAKLFMRSIESRYRSTAKQYPRQCGAIERWMGRIDQIEDLNEFIIDEPALATGEMLADLFCWRKDIWEESLRHIGRGLGQFIYFMDAYDDVKRDKAKSNFNPLLVLMERSDYEELCVHTMQSMLAESAYGFEQLPIVKNVDLLRNILYSGVWTRYNQLHASVKKRAKRRRT
ncbi:MAG: hypothetical protein IJ074_03245 [Clostridia bacterium]|nr:hypothetical protein [Clostridia bacterium]